VRAVIDTNVIISGVLSAGSPPDKVVRAALSRTFEAVSSLALLHELEVVLSRPRILERLHWRTEDVGAFVGSFAAVAELFASRSEVNVFIDDPSDNRLLEAAVARQADYIVSGDRALLDLAAYEGIEIVTPARFAAILALEASNRE
jgi:putative PIN family toxin of toxin-antitoxin system